MKKGKKEGYIFTLYRNHRELTILEWVYGGLALVAVVLAGIIALVNQPLGVAILIVPLVSFVAFAMNIVTWALVKFVLELVHPQLRLEVTDGFLSENQNQKTKNNNSSSKSKRSAAAKTSSKTVKTNSKNNAQE